MLLCFEDCRSVCPSTVHPSIHPFYNPFIHPPTYPSIHRCIHPLFIYPSIHFLPCLHLLLLCRIYCPLCQCGCITSQSVSQSDSHRDKHLFIEPVGLRNLDAFGLWEETMRVHTKRLRELNLQPSDCEITASLNALLITIPVFLPLSLSQMFSLVFLLGGHMQSI